MAMMKGIDEFIWVVAIALILVVIFMVAAALLPTNPITPGNQTGNGTVPGNIATFSQLGFVGYSSSYAGQAINYGSFVVGQAQAENLKKATQMDICAGLWCNRRQELPVSVADYYMDTLKDVKITFAVYDTNQYGDLVVKWNGREMSRGRLAARDYTIIVDRQYVKDANTLVIYAEGPGLMFWASTVYTIRDFRADIEYGPAHINTFALSQNELSAWNSADLNFYGSPAAGSSGQLRVRMNNNQVFIGLPSGQQTIALNYSNSGPKIGENLIVFDAPVGGVFNINNLQLRLYLMTNQVVKSKTFALSQADYSRLSRGTITFSVNSVQRDGDMSMKLNGRQLVVPKPVAGSNVVYFNRADAAQGTNTLEITGSGYWDIGELAVTV